MEFKTTFNIAPSPEKITYNDPVMFIGSCFASSIGSQFEAGHMPVMINPAGTVYNPVSVSNTINSITSGTEYRECDLYNYKGIWLSFNHYTDFSSESTSEVLDKINRNMNDARKFISSAKFLFITLGTARVYRWRESGKIVSNCHKIPSSEFTNELLSVTEIVTLWNELLNKLKVLNPGLKIIFSISPVRHMKDGAHGNQVSKSVLFLAVEELMKHESCPGYFPAYELVMDDLRDYRFYDDDMLHPSSSAIEYIWDAFSHCYFDNNTLKLWHEVSGISKAVSHRVQSQSGRQVKNFAETIISRIDAINKKAPSINLDNEREYFLKLL
jgi:GSCFA family.